jgi:hypothetical protein
MIKSFRHKGLQRLKREVWLEFSLRTLSAEFATCYASQSKEA